MLKWIAVSFSIAGIVACTNALSKSSALASGANAAAAPAPFSLRSMLENIGGNVLVPQARVFHQRAELFKNALGGYCAALGTGDYANALDRTRTEWKGAMLAYHRFAAIPVGPLTDNGAALSDNMYSWPQTNICGIDLEVAKLANGRAPTARLLYTLKGLAALEYLVFDDQLGTACNARNRRHRPAFDWAAKPELEKRQSRCVFAQQLADDLLRNAETLDNAWSPAGGNFTATLTDGSRFRTLNDAVNAISDGLFTVEYVKDIRLARPLGLNRDCLNASGKCPELAEHPYSGLAIAAIGARLEGYRAAFTGGLDGVVTGLGLSDYLTDVGHPEVARHLLENTDRALAGAKVADGLGNFQAQIAAMDKNVCKATTTTNRSIEICAVFRDLREVALKMKSEFLTALSLDAPPTHQGDND